MSDRDRRSFGERLCGRLLGLYPSEFRARYARQMADFHRDNIREAKRAGRSMFPVWCRAIADLVLSAGAEHLHTVLPREPVMRTVSHDFGYAACGLAVGIAASIVMAQAIRAMLVDVSAIDLPSLTVTAVLLVIVAVAATVAPALRALRVNPLDVIRNG
jgi:hypothetical protein